MRIAILSDCHLGYAWGEIRGQDSFAGLTEALERSKDADLILIAGDLFDSRIPKPEIFARAAKILSKSRERECGTRLLETHNKQQHEISSLAFKGIPIVAIHGTHERRARQLVNPVQALEHAGLLIHLHCASAVFEIDGKKVAVHGMSGVPERYAKDVLLGWDPKPVQGAINILMLHQSISPYIYSNLEPPSLGLENLPGGFDLYVLGHMHWHELKRFRGTNLLLPGSTSPTVIRRAESGQSKSIFCYDGNLLERLQLTSQRRIIWHDFGFHRTVIDDIKAELSKIQRSDKKPIVVIKIRGTIPADCQIPNFAELEERFADLAIIHINKALQTESFEQQVRLLRELREKALSPEQSGLALLAENLKQAGCNLNAEEIFELLVEGQVDMIFDLLLKGEQ
jgi:DNA repair exonuclease SbcCD nuclease subunit